MFENIRYDLTRIGYGRRGCFLYLTLMEENEEQTLWVCALLSQMEYAVPQGQYPAEYWEVSGAFGEGLIEGGFSDLNDEELWQLLETYQEMLTSFIVIIA